MNIKQFIDRHGIRIDSSRLDRNPHMEDFQGDHWRVTLRCGRRQMTLPFSKGYGHEGREPETAEVLDCMASDASGADQGFEDWASDLGYNTDSRKAERTYKAVQSQTVKLRKLLGDRDFTALLEMERM